MYLNYSRIFIYISELNTQEFLSSWSLHSSGRKQIVNNTCNRKINYMTCYDKKNKVKIRNREEWKIIAILNSIV